MYTSIEFLIIGLFFIMLSLLAALVLYGSSTLWPLLQEQLEHAGRQRLAKFIGDQVALAVAYAEQIGEDNADKKRLATQFLERELAAFGIRLEPARIDDLIEATVFKVFNQWIGFIPDVSEVPAPEPAETAVS